MSTKDIGALGEKIASEYLIKKGYKILAQSYISKLVSGPMRGEIDIIAKPRRSTFSALRGKKNDTVHFIEVKTIQQTQAESFLPEDKVDFQKQRKIMKMAENWLMENKIPLNSQWQIDVISIVIDLKNKKAKIRHFQNAAPY